MFASIIIEYNAQKLDKTFTYKIPTELEQKIKIGMKVYVPFRNQKIIGFVIDIMKNIENQDYEIKEVIKIEDEKLVLNTELMEVGKYLSEITMCSLITAYQTMLPNSLKIKKQKHNYELLEEYLSIKDLNKAKEYINFYKRRTKQIEILNEIIKKGRISKKGISSTNIKQLIENNIIKIEQEKKYRINVENNNLVIKKLTDEQKSAYEKVNFSNYKTYLLYGITGSGKTEVYINLIKRSLELGKTAIMLVPEIGLTTQIAKRFYEAFGSNVAILHSSLSSGERYDEYIKIMNGEVKIVVGTRSAIFAPLKNLGIIIIDEEDSPSYKQDNNPRYHARDIAIFRGKYNNIPVLLGSATPSLESKARADKSVYQLLKLDKRVGNAKLPIIHIVDMEKEIKKKNTIFSDLLKEKIWEKINKKEQIILLLNRRGFSTFITCSNCGYVYKCPNCDITLTYHKSSNNLICHYCGYQKRKDDKCPICHEESLNYYGLGTEKLEEKIRELFPSIRVIRMDQDTTRNKGMHEKIINDFKNQKYDLLLGTQMISKGLDFEKVSLVGVLNADTSLNMPDFKSSENSFSLLNQVAGRAGRSKILGEVVIQTYNPDNYVIKCVQNNSYDNFYLHEMQFRKRLKYPPYYYLISLKIIGKDYDKTIEYAKKTKRFLESNINKETIVLGPTTAAVFRYNNEFRMQIIIKYKKDNELMNTLKNLKNIFININECYLEIDFNPIKV